MLLEAAAHALRPSGQVEGHKRTIPATDSQLTGFRCVFFLIPVMYVGMCVLSPSDIKFQP